MHRRLLESKRNESVMLTTRTHHCNMLKSKVLSIVKTISSLRISHYDDILNPNAKFAVCIVSGLLKGSF